MKPLTNQEVQMADVCDLTLMALKRSNRLMEIENQILGTQDTVKIAMLMDEHQKVKNELTHIQSVLDQQDWEPARRAQEQYNRRIA